MKPSHLLGSLLHLAWHHPVPSLIVIAVGALWLAFHRSGASAPAETVVVERSGAAGVLAVVAGIAGAVLYFMRKHAVVKAVPAPRPRIINRTIVQHITHAAPHSSPLGWQILAGFGAVLLAGLILRLNGKA